MLAKPVIEQGRQVLLITLVYLEVEFLLKMDYDCEMFTILCRE